MGKAFEGKRLGELLLVNALTRAQLYSQAGGIGLFAIDERAAGYYRLFGFRSAPDNALLLLLPASVAG